MLGALRERMLQPDAVAAYIEEKMLNLAERYRRGVAGLSEALAGGMAEAQTAREALRCLVAAVIASPAQEGRGVALEVRGQFAAMVAIANDGSAPGGASGCMLRWLRGQDLVAIIHW